ncbi:hypothetical protein V6N11_078946 [Hibiscus sabdariffa]|uniref:Uncharacterized protein n=1 Tax=Hibiscus sabdariffa TaxID=183260 RepID=A0ABR2RUR1_9ROSI
MEGRESPDLSRHNKLVSKDFSKLPNHRLGPIWFTVWPWSAPPPSLCQPPPRDLTRVFHSQLRLVIRHGEVFEGSSRTLSIFRLHLRDFQMCLSSGAIHRCHYCFPRIDASRPTW